MKSKAKLLLIILVAILGASLAKAFDAAEAYEDALKIDQTDLDKDPILRIGYRFKVMANEANATNNMKIVDNIITFPVLHNDVVGLKVKWLALFPAYKDANNYVYGQVNSSSTYVRKELCTTLKNWGDYDTALQVSAYSDTWDYYFSVPHKDIASLATQAVNDPNASFSKKRYAANYLFTAQGDEVTWNTVARYIVDNSPSSGKSSQDRVAKVESVQRLILIDPNYIVKISESLVEDESGLLQISVLGFLSKQANSGNTTALNKLLYISQNASAYDVKVKAKYLYDQLTN